MQGLKTNQTHYLERWNLIILTSDKLAALLVLPTNWRCLPDQIGIWTCWFWRREENQSTQSKTSRGRGEIQQQTIIILYDNNNVSITSLEPQPHWLQASPLAAVQSLLPHPCLKVNRKTSSRLSNGMQGFRLCIIVVVWSGQQGLSSNIIFLCDFSQLFQIRTVFISLPLETWPTRAA